MQTPRLWQVVLCTTFVASIASYFFFTSPATSTHTPIDIIQSDAGVDEEVEPPSKYYQWRTTTSFPALEPGLATNASLDDLCTRFPKHKLRDIQPVLKTGHGVMGRVRKSLQSTSACLDNLLIFSDLDEVVDGHQVVDVIADIPQRMLLAEDAFNQTLPYRELISIAANGTLDDTTMTKVEGWRTDKFKFLVAISHAWRDAPERRWYVFYEGDTYIVWDTVFRLLDNFDADKPHYFGSPSPGREETWFGNGGPGYILSREAMRRLVKDDWDPNTGEWLGSKFLEAYWENILGDCCGDSVLGWALHERGVDVSGLWPLFNPHPLHGVPFADQYWCQPVLSMHKSDYADEDDFWRWEWDALAVNPQRPVTYRDIADSFLNITSFTEVREDWDNGEWDSYPPAAEEAHESAASCLLECEMDRGCFQWTYHLRTCYFVRSFRVGRSKEPLVEKHRQDQEWTREETRFTAGWDIPKIQKWIDDRPCEEIEWVKPSIERIF